MNFKSLDENGLVLEDAEDAKATGRQRASGHQAGCIDATAPFICDAKGEVTGFKTPAGSMATEQEIAADALEWSKSFACDARSCHAVNHDHDCTETCVKKAKKIWCTNESAREHGAQAAWKGSPAVQVPIL